MLSRAASPTSSPFTWLPMTLRSPAVATMLTSPWLRMVLPTADWSWLVWLALELEAPMSIGRTSPQPKALAPSLRQNFRSSVCHLDFQEFLIESKDPGNFRLMARTKTTKNI